MTSENKTKQVSRVLIGIVLTGVVWIVSACAINFLSYIWRYSNNPIVVDDGARNLQFLAGLCAIVFSLAYFRGYKRQIKFVLSVHFMLAVAFLMYFGNQYIAIRNDQRQVLLKYQQFRQALLDEDYLKAYELMSPEWRKSHSVDDMEWEARGFLDLGPEDSVYSVHIYDKSAVIVPNPQTTWWFRPSAGNSRSFEKIGSEWYVSPRNIDFFLVPG